MSLIDDIKTDLERATPGPWVSETVRTSCGTCHKVGPFPAPSYHRKPDTHACLYDDYPPGKGHPHLLANASLIAKCPDMAKALLAADALADAIARSDPWEDIDAAMTAYREATS